MEAVGAGAFLDFEAVAAGEEYCVAPSGPVEEWEVEAWHRETPQSDLTELLVEVVHRRKGQIGVDLHSFQNLEEEHQNSQPVTRVIREEDPAGQRSIGHLEAAAFPSPVELAAAVPQPLGGVEEEGVDPKAFQFHHSDELGDREAFHHSGELGDREAFPAVDQGAVCPCGMEAAVQRVEVPPLADRDQWEPLLDLAAVPKVLQKVLALLQILLMLEDY